MKAGWIAAATLALAISGCNRSATGQVVAVVNGEEVSQSELSAELAAGGARGNVDKAVRQAALQRLIDRKLLVQAAKDRKLDQDPEFLQQQRRMNDDLLIGMLGKQVTGNLAVPGQPEIDRFVAANPAMFADRTIFALDQIIFAPPADQSRLGGLRAAKDMAGVVAVLNQLQIPFSRRTGTLDTAAAPPEVVAQVVKLPPGEPFVIGAQGQAVVSVITGQTKTPLTADQTRQVATAALRQQKGTDTAQGVLKQARAAAKIEYQAGMAPPAQAKGAAAK